jgi:hypothetical protein
MSNNELKTFNVDMKLHGFVTIQMRGKSKDDVINYLETFESSECFKFNSSEFIIEDSCIDYFEIQDVQKVS